MVPGNSNGTAARYREHFAYRAGPLCGGVGCPTEISKERASKVGRPNERAMSELGHERRGRAHKPEPRRPQCADCVEKLICASGRERLIQDQAPTRNNDSRTDPPGFLYCKFCFHSARSASFSTQSALSGSGRSRRRTSASGGTADSPTSKLPFRDLAACGRQRDCVLGAFAALR